MQVIRALHILENLSTILMFTWLRFKGTFVFDNGKYENGCKITDEGLKKLMFSV